MATKDVVQEAADLWSRGEEVRGRTTVVPQEVCCDMCFNPAIVLGQTVAGRQAYICLRHFHRLGVGLGTDRGQVLIWRKGV